MKLTERDILNLKPRAKRYSEFIDGTPGLGVKIYPSGRKKYFVQGKPLGSINQVTVTLGDIGGVTLEWARERSQACMQLMKEGKNPNRLREDTNDNTVERLVKDYCRMALNGMRSKHKKTVERVLHQDWLGLIHNKPTRSKPAKPNQLVTMDWVAGPFPYLRDRPVLRVETRDGLDRIDQIRRKRGEHAARGAMAIMRAAWTWAADSGRYGLQTNIFAGFKDKTVGLTSKELRRKRWLTDDELRRVWKASEQMGIYGKIIQLLILTGVRRDEIGEAEWVELKDNVLIVPPERFKTDVEHQIPLTPMALEIINSVERKGSYIFTTSGRNPFNGWSKAKLKLDETSGVTGWVVHDLRRTVRSNLRKLRIPPYICELVLGHSQKGIVETYDRFDPLDEKREALEKWATAIQAIINPPPSQEGNVVTLRLAS